MDYTTGKTYLQLKDIPRRELRRAWEADRERALLWLLGVPLVGWDGRPDPRGVPDQAAWRSRGEVAARSAGERSCAALALAIYRGGEAALPTGRGQRRVAHDGSTLASIMMWTDTGNYLAAMEVLALWRHAIENGPGAEVPLEDSGDRLGTGDGAARILRALGEEAE